MGFWLFFPLSQMKPVQHPSAVQSILSTILLPGLKFSLRSDLCQNGGKEAEESPPPIQDIQTITVAAAVLSVILTTVHLLHRLTVYRQHWAVPRFVSIKIIFFFEIFLECFFFSAPPLPARLRLLRERDQLCLLESDGFTGKEEIVKIRGDSVSYVVVLFQQIHNTKQLIQ